MSQGIFAARYAWLRAQHWFDGPVAVVLEPKQALKLGSTCLSEVMLDSFIDQRASLNAFDQPRGADPIDRVAWALSQIIDNDAPIHWQRYRFVAEYIAKNPALMNDLKLLQSSR